ncbi:MAG: hypothetical protein OXG56_13310 [Gammaproteobacteria bacterium]|nr:hypothetical protein [Gammaproteobacteria bacterium]
MSQMARRRRMERHCAAAIRAISSDLRVEYRNQALYLNGRILRFYVPHLVVDAGLDSVHRCRGAADAIALRLLYSDQALHRRLMPDQPVAMVVFDILEQLRTESLAAGTMPGLTGNLQRSFKEWCLHSRGQGMVENELGLLLYSLVQIARARLIRPIDDEEVEGIIESVRFRLAPLIGTDLAELRKSLEDQSAFSARALNIAGILNEIARSSGMEMLARHFASLRSRNLLPPVVEPEGQQDDSAEVDSRWDDLLVDRQISYPVFCRDFDKEVFAAELYRKEQRIELRNKLDQMIAAQAISVVRLAQKLQRLFAVPQESGWHDGEDDGYIDGRRLSQMVSRPGYHRIFKQERLAPRCETIVTFLMDNSGSMKRQRYEAVAILVDIYCRALELAGVNTEVLGFTTRGWTGGESIKSWRRAGSPENPGRLNDRLHIVYKDAETSWRQSRYSLCSMMNPTHFKEGLDGEALQWAARRLLDRAESRKCLVMISDGAPMDSATSHYNEPSFLERHLKTVATLLEESVQLELRAIGIALDMGEFFRDSMTLDLTGTLGNRVFSSLETLFSPRPHTLGRRHRAP